MTVRPDDDTDAPADAGHSVEPGAPVGRRVLLGLMGVGTAGVVLGSHVQDALSRWLAPVENQDPTGLIALLPLGDAFRYYSVTGSVPHRGATDYRLAVSGEVTTKATYTLADLHAMPQTSLVATFQCVTGWHVPEVHWSGVRLSTLIERARPTAAAKAVRFRSFDGTYTESLTLEQAYRSDVIVALQMFGKPVTHDHGGPVRMYCASLYGYKSTKWLSSIELTTEQVPGYWEDRGYDLDGTISR